MLNLVCRVPPSQHIAQHSLIEAQQSKQNPGVYGAFPYIYQLPPMSANMSRSPSADSQTSSESLEGEDSAELPSPQKQPEALQPDLQSTSSHNSSEDMGKSSEQSLSRDPHDPLGEDEGGPHSTADAVSKSDAADLLEERHTSSRCSSGSSSLAPDEAQELEEPVMDRNGATAAAEGFVARRSLDGAASALSREHSGLVSRTSSRGSMSAMYR